MARRIPAKAIEDVARELMARAAIDIPADYREGVVRARDAERNRIARFVLDEMLRNWEIATAERRPMCADTGLPRYYVRVGNEASRRGRLRRAGACPAQGHRGGDRGHSPAAEPRAPAHADGSRQQRRHARARGHVRVRARGRLGRHHDRPQGRAVRQRLPHALSGRRHRRDQAVRHRHARGARQAWPGLPAGHRGHRHRRLQGHVHASGQGGGLPAHRRQPQPRSGDRAAGGRADRARQLHRHRRDGVRRHVAGRGHPHRGRLHPHRAACRSASTSSACPPAARPRACTRTGASSSAATRAGSPTTTGARASSERGDRAAGRRAHGRGAC